MKANLTKVVARLTEAAAAKAEVVSLIFTKADLTVKNVVKLSNGVFAVTFSGKLHGMSDCKQLAGFIKPTVSEGYFQAVFDKRSESVWISAPLTPKAGLQIEFLAAWGVALVTIDYGMAEGPYLMEALK